MALTIKIGIRNATVFTEANAHRLTIVLSGSEDCEIRSAQLRPPVQNLIPFQPYTFQLLADEVLIESIRLAHIVVRVRRGELQKVISSQRVSSEISALKAQRALSSRPADEITILKHVASQLAPLQFQNQTQWRYDQQLIQLVQSMQTALGPLWRLTASYLCRIARETNNQKEPLWLRIAATEDFVQKYLKDEIPRLPGRVTTRQEMNICAADNQQLFLLIVMILVCADRLTEGPFIGITERYALGISEYVALLYRLVGGHDNVRLQKLLKQFQIGSVDKVLQTEQQNKKLVDQKQIVQKIEQLSGISLKIVMGHNFASVCPELQRLAWQIAVVRTMAPWALTASEGVKRAYKALLHSQDSQAEMRTTADNLVTQLRLQAKRQLRLPFTPDSDQLLNSVISLYETNAPPHLSDRETLLFSKAVQHMEMLFQRMKQFREARAARIIQRFHRSRTPGDYDFAAIYNARGEAVEGTNPLKAGSTYKYIASEVRKSVNFGSSTALLYSIRNGDSVEPPTVDEARPFDESEDEPLDARLAFARSVVLEATPDTGVEADNIIDIRKVPMTTMDDYEWSDIIKEGEAEKTLIYHGQAPAALSVIGFEDVLPEQQGSSLHDFAQEYADTLLRQHKIQLSAPITQRLLIPEEVAATEQETVKLIQSNFVEIVVATAKIQHFLQTRRPITGHLLGSLEKYLKEEQEQQGVVSEAVKARMDELHKQHQLENWATLTLQSHIKSVFFVRKYGKLRARYSQDTAELAILRPARPQKLPYRAIHVGQMQCLKAVLTIQKYCKKVIKRGMRAAQVPSNKAEAHIKIILQTDQPWKYPHSFEALDSLVPNKAAIGPQIVSQAIRALLGDRTLSKYSTDTISLLIAKCLTFSFATQLQYELQNRIQPSLAQLINHIIVTPQKLTPSTAALLLSVIRSGGSDLLDHTDRETLRNRSSTPNPELATALQIICQELQRRPTPE